MRQALLAVTVVSLLLGCAPTGPAMRGDAEASEGATPCTSDLDCMPGDECIRPQGQTNGLCGKVRDANGQPTTGVRRSIAPCTNDFDCPVRSHCQLTTATVGVCVAQ